LNPIASANLEGRNRFEGKSVLVTGGAAGIGLAAAQMFAAEGARVSIIDIQEEAGQAFVDEIESAGGQAFFQAANLANPDQTNQALDNVINHMGTIDTLFNHAGTIIVKPFHETTDEDYDRLMDINLRSAFMVTRKVVQHMKDNGGGSIVITASIGSGKAFVYESLYCITKAAVLMLSNAIAVEYRDHGIRCNAVCPGFVKTAHGLREIDELDGLGQQWQEADLEATQVRICEPEEVAAAALFLASEEASFINGTALYVDNGWFVKG
jgi:NAD(P)-dependent dehydrogenase (short-subunit alcohol dehydrogenase family)